MSGLAEPLERNRFQGMIINSRCALYAPGLTSSQVQIICRKLLLLPIHLKLFSFTGHNRLVILLPFYQGWIL